MPATKRNKYTKLLVWAALSVPAIHTFVRYLTDQISYGQVIHETGDWSVGLLCLALAATPVRRILPGTGVARWLMTHRRAVGVASFGYAAFHTLTYLERKWGYGYIQQEALEPGILTGWIALAIFIALAMTSNNKSVKVLRRNWQRLHRLVYPAAVLTFAHWILTAFEPQIAYACLLAFCLLQALRLVKKPLLTTSR